jgi:hypothetical protein
MAVICASGVANTPCTTATRIEVKSHAIFAVEYQGELMERSGESRGRRQEYGD